MVAHVHILEMFFFLLSSDVVPQHLRDSEHLSNSWEAVVHCCCFLDTQNLLDRLEVAVQTICTECTGILELEGTWDIDSWLAIPKTTWKNFFH